MADFLMPALGASMESGKLIEWRSRPGDHVNKGDIIAVVETDKGAIEVEVFTSGTVERILVEPGATVPVGTPMAIIREQGAPETAAIPPPAAAPSAPSVPAAPLVPSAPSVPRASPRARRRAAELGIDLAAVSGSGPDGAITAEDVERARPTDQADPRARMRRAIAAAMSLSKREIPHFYLGATIDMGRALDWLERQNRGRPPPGRLLPGALLLKAVALAVRAVPELNAHFSGESAPPIPDVHLGVAISMRDGGLVAPAIHHADRLDLGALMAALRDLVGRARGGGLRASELVDGTITVTSLGDRGADIVYPVIFPPQVAMVGFGAIATRPWVVDGQVMPRPVVQVSLAADHRATDGHRATRLLDEIAARLQEPEKL